MSDLDGGKTVNVSEMPNDIFTYQAQVVKAINVDSRMIVDFLKTNRTFADDILSKFAADCINQSERIWRKMGKPPTGIRWFVECCENAVAELRSIRMREQE